MTHYDRRAGLYLEVMVERLSRLGLFVMVLILSIAAGYWYLQGVQANHYRRLAENNRLRQAPIRAPRGVIEDRFGRTLVENVPSYSLILDRTLTERLESSLRFAAPILGKSADELETALAAAPPRQRRVKVAVDLDLSQVARFEAVVLERPEFQIEVDQRRLYRHGEQTAHLLGYLGEASQEDLDRGDSRIVGGDLVGKEGIELAKDSSLRGVDGRRTLVVDSRNRVIDVVSRDPTHPGDTVRLTIDLDLQQEAVQLMRGKVGAVIAIDPRDGAVRAMVSQPSFDPNLFAGGLAEDTWKAIVERPHNVLQNRAFAATYPPGSVFKVVVALAGLESGAIDPNERIFCAGTKRIYNRNQRCWKRGGHGWVNLNDAITHSCDIYFYVQGQEIGIDNIARWAKALGLGHTSGIGLRGEKAGLVPDPEWSRRVRGAPWYPGETISVAIGQGPLLMTPLQGAVLMSTIANGGRRVVPHLILGQQEEGTQVDINPHDLNLLRNALLNVTEKGSGRGAKVAGIKIAGKTGTSQVIEQKTWTDSADLAFAHRDHAWFASYAPFDNPELVVVVLVEHGGSGGAVAAPIARAIYEKYFRVRRQTS